MRLTLLLALLALCHTASAKKKIKWQCLNAINAFRAKAAGGGLNSVLHKAAERVLEDRIENEQLRRIEHERSRKLLETSLGPMANVRRMYWDEEMAASAREVGLTCPEVGGKKGEKYREFSLYYSSQEYDGVEDMLTRELEFMTPWMKEIAPPSSEVNNTYYFYVAGEFFWATRDRIGCALVSCEGKTLLECHLGPGNTLDGMPYIPGKACSKCEPGFVCEDKLCIPQGAVRVKGETSASTTVSLLSRLLFPAFFSFSLCFLRF